MTSRRWSDTERPSFPHDNRAYEEILLPEMQGKLIIPDEESDTTTSVKLGFKDYNLSGHDSKSRRGIKRYLDTPLNRRLGRVGMGMGSVIFRDEESDTTTSDKLGFKDYNLSGHDSKSRREIKSYIDTPMNRRLVREGMGNLIIRDEESDTTTSDKLGFKDYNLSGHDSKSRRGIKSYIDTPMNRRLVREGMSTDSDEKLEETASLLEDLIHLRRRTHKLGILTDSDDVTTITGLPLWKSIIASLHDIESLTNQLIERNDLPEQSELDLLIRKVGRHSPIAKQICTAICTYLKDSNCGVVEAWAAYSYKHIPSEQKTDTENEHILFEQKTDTENEHIPSEQKTDTENEHIPSEQKTDTKNEHIPSEQKIDTENEHIPSEQKTDTEDKHIPSEQKIDTENDVVFVLKTKDEEKLNISKYRTCVIHLGKISQEEENINQSILNFEREHELPSEELDKLIDFVNNISNNLMKKHSNVTMISASWCKHISSGKESAQLVLSPCVALYVPIKGYIPIDEDPFETKFGGYPVDVREGVFKSLSGANKYHRNLRMGCAITAGSVDEDGNVMGGTLGPFVKIAEKDFTYAITSAHVVLDHLNFKKTIEEKEVNFGLVRPNVYHPISEHQCAFGQLIFASYTPGENGTSGLEIAVIEMQPERCPIDGTFPEVSNYLGKGFEPDNPFAFNNGQCCDLRFLRRSQLVIKYGSTTELTKGTVRVHGSTVRTGELKKNILGSELILHNQIEIESLSSHCFADFGDSGALVLTESDEGLVAVGILEGQVNDVCIVTPIKSILDDISGKIGQCQLLPFKQTPNVTYPRQQCEGSEGAQFANNTNNSSICPPSQSKQLEKMQNQISALQLQTNCIQESQKKNDQRMIRIETMLETLLNRDG